MQPIDDREYAVRTLLGEAADQGTAGLAAVAHVIRNRLNGGGYGDTLADVVTAPKQFSPWNDEAGRSRMFSYASDGPEYQRAATVLDQVLAGKIPDITKGATHFANVAMSDPVNQRGWIKEMIDGGTAVKIGAHTFGRPASAPGRRAEDAFNPEEFAAFKGAGKPAESEAFDPNEFAAFKSAPKVAETEADVQRLERETGMLAEAERPQGLAAAAGAEKPALSSLDLFGRGIQAIRENPKLLAQVGPGRIVAGAAEGATLPGDVAAGRVDPMSEEGIGRAAELAMVGGPRAPAGLIPAAPAAAGSTREAIAEAVRAGRAPVAAGEAAPMTITVRPSPNPAAAEVVDAAARLEVPVSRALASDSAVVEHAGAGLRNVPFASAPLREAHDATLKGLDAARGRTAADLGGASMEQAGGAAGEALSGWIGGQSKAVADRLYRGVDELVNPEAAVPLANTERVVRSIEARRGNARIAGDSKATAEVRQALKPSEAPTLSDGSAIPPRLLDRLRESGQVAAEEVGMNYQGLKDLRSHVGELFKRPPEGMSGTELKLIYGALSDDLRAAVATAGGPKALAAFERANGINRLVEQRRESLARIVGKDLDASPAQIFDRLVAAAGGKSRADTALLTQARKAAGAEAWDEFVGGVVGRLGSDAQGQFSPLRFLTDYGRLSDAGKDVLFNSTGRASLRRALDDIATVSARIKDRERLANPSGTARNASFTALGAGLATAPLTTIGTVLGARTLARVLAEPATASSAARWVKAHEAVAVRPTPASVAAFQRASRDLAATVGARAGVSVSAEEIAAPVIKALNDNLRGTRSATAAQQDERDNR